MMLAWVCLTLGGLLGLNFVTFRFMVHGKLLDSLKIKADAGSYVERSELIDT